MDAAKEELRATSQVFDPGRAEREKKYIENQEEARP